MKKLLLVLAVCILLSGCSLMADRVEGRLTWDADMLLIWRPGSDRCLLVEDLTELFALRDSHRWYNSHLECCVADPDFWGYVYRYGEQVDRLYGHDNVGTDSYNAAFVRRLTALGQAEPNAWVYRVTIPAGADESTLAAQLGGHVLPTGPEEDVPRHARLVATVTTWFDEGADITDAWWGRCALGEFEGDAPLMPLLYGLAEEGVLLYADSVFMRTGHFTDEPGQSNVQREVTFYLTGEPSFDSWEGVEIAVYPAQAWEALLVTEAPLTADDCAVLETRTGVIFQN